MRDVKESIIGLLKETGRNGIGYLLLYMEENGFFDSPCSTSHHLSNKGGLAEHSLNVYEIAEDLRQTLCPETDSESIIITALLHDIGKMGQFGKPEYVPNMLKGRATKANPNPEPYQSPDKPYAVNPDLLYIDHEVRSIAIISQYIELTEYEQQAILWHNGLYGPFKYEIQGKETPLYMILHWADMWASRVVEKEGKEEETSE